MGQEMLTVFNGSTGWKPGRAGLEAMSEEDIIALLEDDKRETIKIFQASDEPYYQAVFDGEGEINGVKFEYVSLLDTDNKSICRLGIASNGLLICKEYWGKSAMGTDGSVQELFLDYAEHNGVNFPMKTVKNIDGANSGNVVWTEFTVNGDIPTGSFEKSE